MWKASVGHQPLPQDEPADDDWETDTDFVNDVTEQEQRWGSKTVAGSGRTAGTINMQQLRMETEQSDAMKKKKLLEDQNAGFGYGGKFGIEHDRMDKSAVGHDYIGKVEKHGSQKDYSDGFGGKFGVQSDRVDKSAAGWDHKETVQKHSSQKDYSDGFGGKFGIQQDRVDKSAVGWDHIEKVEKHESQKDYSKGFGGKFGVQEDRKDKSALGWDHVEKSQKHESQTDHKVGFGGKFGVQNDRMDKSALGFQDNADKIGTNYTKTKPDIGAAKPSNLRAKFENLAKVKQEEDEERANEQKKARAEKDRIDREQAAKKTFVENVPKQGDKNNSTATTPTTAAAKNIETGRMGSVMGAINQFNQVQSPTSETIPMQRKEPIVLPKEPEPIIQPDVIPTQIDVQIPSDNDNHQSHHQEEQVYANIETTKTAANVDASQTVEVEKQQQQHQHETEQTNEIPMATSNEPIYQNQDDLSEFIEDTGLRALALYDYQAAADDEISFDPDDLITHIEMIDEGWWRGLCKNRYGLFPANYVQLQK